MNGEEDRRCLSFVLFFTKSYPKNIQKEYTPKSWGVVVILICGCAQKKQTSFDSLWPREREILKNFSRGQVKAQEQ